MGFREFDMGISSNELNRRREVEAEARARQIHHQIEELIAILRPHGDELHTASEKFLLWKAENPI